MSFRRRITLAAAAAVAIAIVLTSVINDRLISDQLHNQVDAQLRGKATGARRLLYLLKNDDRPTAVVQASLPFLTAVSRLAQPSRGAAVKRSGSTRSSAPAPAGETPIGRLPSGPTQVSGYQQVVGADGTILVHSTRAVNLPVDAVTRKLAREGGAPVLRDARVNGVHMRMLSEPFGAGRAVQFAEPLTEVNSLLDRLLRIRVLVGLGGIVLAALLGRLVAGAAVLPLKRLTKAAEHVAETRDLSGRIESVGEDEIGRLAVSFNAMLDALEQSMGALDASVDAQRQLVADASHELRTPVTSLRTNIEILQQAESMDLEERRRLLDDVVEQIEELTLLMNDLIDLARGEEPRQSTEDVRVDLLVGEVVEAARRRSPQTPFLLELEPTIVTGVPKRLQRAVSNLIDNAVKYSPPGEPVEIAVRGEELTVRDYGPGISAQDLPHVFARFYRGAEARGRPGSGLGLAIVRQVADQLGGSVSAEPGSGRGTLMRLSLPGAETVRVSDEPAPGARAAAEVALAEGERTPV